VSTIALLIILVLVLAAVNTAASLAYLVHRHPNWGQPLLVALAALALLAALVTSIVTR
jgi:uncharacterized integral membrane protein